MPPSCLRNTVALAEACATSECRNDYKLNEYKAVQDRAHLLDAKLGVDPEAEIQIEVLVEVLDQHVLLHHGLQELFKRIERLE